MAPFIDFHSYIGQDPFGDYRRDVDDLIQEMDENGITKSVVSTFVDCPGPGKKGLQYLEKAACRYPERLKPFARLDFRYDCVTPSYLEDLIQDKKFGGLLFNPASTRTLPYRDELVPIMRKAEELSLPVLIPAGNPYFSLPEQIAELAQRCPDLKVIIGNMGTALHATRAIELGTKYQNIFLETSVQQSPERVKIAVNKLGKRRIIFGSSSPYGTLAFEFSKIDRADLDPESREFIFWKNATRLLKGAENT